MFYIKIEGEKDSIVNDLQKSIKARKVFST